MGREFQNQDILRISVSSIEIVTTTHKSFISRLLKRYFFFETGVALDLELNMHVLRIKYILKIRLANVIWLEENISLKFTWPEQE